MSVDHGVAGGAQDDGQGDPVGIDGGGGRGVDGDAAGGLIDHLLALRPATHVKGWWQKHSLSAPERHRTLVQNLKSAKNLTTWHPHALPMFLQSADYMRAAIAASPNVPDEEADRRLKVGQELQELLVGRGLQCNFYVHEQALHLPVGGHDVHVSQVHHLLLMGVRTNITIKIVPTALGAHAGMNEAFTRLTFRPHEPLIFLEHEHSLLIEEDTSVVESYQQVVRALDRASLDAEQSKGLLCRLGESLSVADFRARDGFPAALLAEAPR